MNKHHQLDLWSDRHSLFLMGLTTVIKYKLKIRNRLWNTGAVTQESLQNSSLRKISVSFIVEEKWKLYKVLFVFSGYVHLFCLQVSLWNAQLTTQSHVIFLLSQTQSILHFLWNIFYIYFLWKLSKNCKKKPIDFKFLWHNSVSEISLTSDLAY